MSSALNDIAAERRRQIEVEGYTPTRDDVYRPGLLAQAAAAYAYAASGPGRDHGRLWPWQMRTWKPGDTRRMLVKAGALIAAEIERIDRTCTMCDGTGTKDHAGLAMDPCDHVRSRVHEITHAALPPIGEALDTQGRARAQVQIADAVVAMVPGDVIELVTAVRQMLWPNWPGFTGDEGRVDQALQAFNDRVPA